MAFDVLSFQDDVSSVDLEDYRQLRGWQNQFAMLNQWSKLISTKMALREEVYLLKGCESSVWLAVHSDSDGRLWFSVDAEARLLKGFAAILLLMMNGKRSEELLMEDIPGQVESLGLPRNLSASRANGLTTLYRKMAESAGI